MDCVLMVKLAVLLQLKFSCCVTLVFNCCVILALALSALQQYYCSHERPSSIGFAG